MPEINFSWEFLNNLPGGVWTLIGAIGGLLVAAGVIKGVVGGGASIMFAGSDPDKTARGMQSVKNSITGAGIIIIGIAAVGSVLAFIVGLF